MSVQEIIFIHTQKKKIAESTVHSLNLLGTPEFKCYLAVHTEFKTIFARGFGGQRPPSTLSLGNDTQSQQHEMLSITDLGNFWNEGIQYICQKTLFLRFTIFSYLTNVS